MKYKRIILKLSGEALLGDGDARGVSMTSALSVAREIKEVVEKGLQLGLVIGAGNIFRGAVESRSGEICQAEADKIGMLSTIINAVAMKNAFTSIGLKSSIMSSLPIRGIASSFEREDAIDQLESGRLLIFCGGTGNPFFTTDSAASLRALEIDADALVKGTKVDGVYSDDPQKNSEASRYEKLSYMDVIKEQLKVMDLTAISMCMSNQLPVIVFDIFKSGNLLKVVEGKNIGTVLHG